MDMTTDITTRITTISTTTIRKITTTILLAEHQQAPVEQVLLTMFQVAQPVLHNLKIQLKTTRIQTQVAAAGTTMAIRIGADQDHLEPVEAVVKAVVPEIAIGVLQVQEAAKEEDNYE